MWEMLKKEALISCMKRSLKSCNGCGFLAPSYTNVAEGLGLPACLTRGLKERQEIDHHCSKNLFNEPGWGGTLL